MPSELKELYIFGHIKSFGDYPFYQLNNLLVINLSPNSITHMNEFLPLILLENLINSYTLNSNNNPLNGQSFDLKAFSRTHFILTFEVIQSLHFWIKKFCSTSNENKTIIEVENIPFIWILKNKKVFEDKIHFGKCSDGTLLFDLQLSHFEKCYSFVNSKKNILKIKINETLTEYILILT